MKRTLFFCLALLWPTAGWTQPNQPSGRIHRTEVVPYDTRHNAEARLRAKSGHTIDFRPAATLSAEQLAIASAQVEIPYAWTDGQVFLHLENCGRGYTLFVNDREAGTVHDPLTPAEFDLTGLVREGKNDFRLLLHEDPAYDRLNAEPEVRRTAFAGSYLYTQHKRSIADFRVRIVPDSTGKYGLLDLEIVARNGFNFEEPVEVGYDIYSPEGKLLDFNIVERRIAGRGTDTLRFSPYVYGAYSHRWEPSAKRPPLYRVMLFTRRDGAYKEYMPLQTGFVQTRYADGQWYSFDRPVTLKRTRCNAGADAKSTAARLAALHKQGFNTVEPDYPQPAWFYELCDAEGLYVIDKAAIDAPENRDDRRTGGTPSNDPRLADEYVERVKAMYYRSRNFTCVIAYALGNPSGNGYAMYKAYEWLKSVEHDRPVFYADADGEWNSDL